MRKRKWTTISVGAVMVAAGGFLLLRQHHPRLSFKGYNVVMVSVDTLRADHLGCYGYPRDTSPTIDALAARSLRFHNAYSTAPWTFPAHFSLFTGRYPTRREFFTYPADPHSRAGWDHLITLAEVLQKAGYQTIGATGGAWVSGHLGFSQGFDAYYTHGVRFEDNAPALHGWIDRQEDSRPFFLFVHGYNVHRPYDPPDDLKLRFIDKIPEDCEGVVFENIEPDKGRCLRARAGEKYAISQYDAEILGVDRFLSDLLTRLDRRNLLDRTILVVLSDHGEEFWDHGSVDHINTLYEELIRIPIILHIPGVSPRIIQDPVSILDLMPTLIDLLDLEGVSPSMEGQSWLPLIEGRSQERVIHALTARDDEWAAQNGGAFALLGARWDDQMLIRRLSKGSLVTTELYDLNVDPQERNDVAEVLRYRTRRKTIDERLDRWIATSRIGLFDDTEREHGAILSGEIQESLRALGYID
ncbi:MAG: sulfatase [Vicinamibacteria bacterium]|nr:sulfatase [Vicinamibacteria bacterium]